MSMKSNLLWKLVTGLAVFGIALAVYLLWQLYMRPTWAPCSVNDWINCDALTKGSLSYTLGIPTAYYGLAGYILVLISSIKKWKRVLLGTAIFGLVFCLRIAFIEIIQLKVLCPVCIGCQTAMIGETILAVALYRQNQNRSLMVVDEKKEVK